MEEKDCLMEELKHKVDDKIKEFNTTDINPNNLEALYKLVDIKKDLKNIEYFEKEMEESENEIQRL